LHKYTGIGVGVSVAYYVAVLQVIQSPTIAYFMYKLWNRFPVKLKLFQEVLVIIQRVFSIILGNVSLWSYRGPSLYHPKTIGDLPMNYGEDPPYDNVYEFPKQSNFTATHETVKLLLLYMLLEIRDSMYQNTKENHCWFCAHNFPNVM